ncbi:MAG: helix-turn-helix transcriptional regulator [Actinomycetota bacterium]
MSANGATPASQGAFTASVTAITSAFGDPTRRAIYLFVRGVDDGVTAAEVASEFSLHPNVARHHLDKLAAGNYVEVTMVRPSGGGAGRPSKRYSAGANLPDDVFPVRSDDLVLSLLGKTLALLPDDKAAAIAEEVGQEYGRAMAAALTGSDLATGQRSLRSAMQSVADALTAHGFAAHTEKRNNQLRIVNNHCPFGDVAIEHPVICAVDRGMVKGMLKALYGDADVSTTESLPQGDTFCATAV